MAEPLLNFVLCPSCGGNLRSCGHPLPLDPIDLTAITPEVVAIPLTPTVWDDAENGQHAVTQDGTVWHRRDGLWWRDPWWQGSDHDEIVATCADPEEWAYSLGWPRKQVEDAQGPLTYITIPRRHVADETVQHPDTALTDAEQQVYIGQLERAGRKWKRERDRAEKALAEVVEQERDLRLALVAKIEALADEWERHSRLFTLPVDQPTREDWEHASKKVRALLTDDDTKAGS